MSNPYTLVFTEDAAADLARLDKAVAARIVSKLEWLAQNAETVQHVALTGDWSGYYRLRVGDYRAIYTLDREGRLIVK